MQLYETHVFMVLLSRCIGYVPDYIDLKRIGEIMLNSNYLIIDRQAQQFDKLEIHDREVVFIQANGANVGSIISETVYAALFCDAVNNITFVTDKDGVQSVKTVLWAGKNDYISGKEQLRTAVNVRFSRQNKKLNRYAEELAKKLDIGVRIQVIDAVEESNLVKCPDCGMMSPKGTEYCMDCGAELPLE